MKLRILLTSLAVALSAAAGAGSTQAASKTADKPASKPDAKSAPSSTSTLPAKADPGVVAIVGDQKITDQELNASLPDSSQKMLKDVQSRIEDAERSAVREIFAQRYIQEQTTAQHITEEDLLQREIAANRDSFPKAYKTQITQARQREFDLKRGALDELINQKLEASAAKAKGVTVDQLNKTEIEDKVAPVTQAEIDQMYDQNKSRIGNQTKEQVTPQISDMLKRNRIQQRRTEYLASLRSATPSKTYLEIPPVPDLSDDDPTRGPKDAPVQIVMFSDFQCPFCSRVEGTLKMVREHYGDKVAITFRDFPLSFHPFAEKAAEAANCANKQGKYWEYHDASFANQGQLDVANLKKRAESLSLDMDAFNKCLDSGETKAEIDKDQDDGQSLGVTGTPASFINGRFVNGAQPYEAFQKIIDDELTMRGVPLPPAQSAAVNPAAPGSAPPAAVKN